MFTNVSEVLAASIIRASPKCILIFCRETSRKRPMDLAKDSLWWIPLKLGVLNDPVSTTIRESITPNRIQKHVAFAHDLHVVKLLCTVVVFVSPQCPAAASKHHSKQYWTEASVGVSRSSTSHDALLGKYYHHFIWFYVVAEPLHDVKL
jgi:hypothetical protein